MKIIFAVLMVLLMASLSSAQEQTFADVIFINGDIYSGMASVALTSGKNVLQGSFETKRTQAIAVSMGKIFAVGTNDEIQKLKGPNTQVIDLGGHFVMPGFNDAHTHLAN